MQGFRGALVLLLLLAIPSIALAAKPGDYVEVTAASLTFGGELVSAEGDALRVRLESGVIAIPRQLVTSVRVVREAPAPPELVAPTAPAAPGQGKPRGPWVDRWGKMLSLGVIAGSGRAHDTPIEARSPARSQGASLGYEHPYPFVAIGSSLAWEQMSESLVAKGKIGCPSNAGGACFEFPDGLMHTTQSTCAFLYVKPYFMFGRVRPWVRGGGEAAFVNYTYRSSKSRFGAGNALAFGARYGAGVDLASKRRRFVLTLAVDGGGAHYREEIDRLFGAPWKTSDAGSRSTDLRGEVSVALWLGGRQ